MTLNILFIGDVVGRPGREALEDRLASLRTELDASVCIVNGENVADGVGITPKLADRLLAAGADAITLGNHTWRRQEIGPYLAASDRVIRPANLPESGPGKGVTLVDALDGTRVGVINVMGSLSLQPARSMWEIVDELVDEMRETTPVILVDVHAEATSEKIALAQWLDGRVTAVVGTHTHVQTADEQILPGGTAYITDVGMTGPHDGVIGVEREPVINRFLSGLPARFEAARGMPKLHAVVITADTATGEATTIERISLTRAALEAM
jgi:metallophosphoesterase (TIGR00282 family)